MEPNHDWTRWLIIALGIWFGVGPALWLLRARAALIAWAAGPLVLLLIWGAHLSLAQRWFEKYGGWWFPSTVEVFTAAFAWGVIFAGSFVVFTVIESWVHRQSNSAMPLPKRRFRALMWGHFFSAIILNVTTGPHHAFGWLTFLDLPLFSILAQLRPGMGSVTFVPGSAALFYPVFGTLLFACLGWSIGYIEAWFVRRGSRLEERGVA